MKLYGFPADMTETEVVAKLFERYPHPVAEN